MRPSRRAWVLVVMLPIAAAPVPDPATDPFARGLLLHPVARCPRSVGQDDILVCGSRADRETARQTLPLALELIIGDRRDDNVRRERHHLTERQSGDGMMSCMSAVGPSGEWGCWARDATRRLYDKGTGRAPPE